MNNNFNLKRYFKNCTNVTRSNMLNVHNIELSGEQQIRRWCMVFLRVGIIDSSETWTSIEITGTWVQLYILGKWGIVHNGVYFATKHVKRVHIRCRCTFYWYNWEHHLLICCSPLSSILCTLSIFDLVTLVQFLKYLIFSSRELN
jgi:hypothetical protein